MGHMVDGRCTIGHKLAKDLIHCEKCKKVVEYSDGRHVNSRNRESLLAQHGMKWLPYSAEDWKQILAGNWDMNIYPWERQPSLVNVLYVLGGRTDG